MGALPNGRDRLVRKEREADTSGLPGGRSELGIIRKARIDGVEVTRRILEDLCWEGVLFEWTATSGPAPLSRCNYFLAHNYILINIVIVRFRFRSAAIHSNPTAIPQHLITDCLLYSLTVQHRLCEFALTPCCLSVHAFVHTCKTVFIPRKPILLNSFFHDKNLPFFPPFV